MRSKSAVVMPRNIENMNIGIFDYGYVGSGSELNPSLSFSNDLNSGVYLNSVGSLGFSAGGINKLILSNATSQFSDNRFIVDTSNYSANVSNPSAILFTDTNAYSNSATYTSGCVAIARETLDHNQPPLVCSIRTSSSSIANNSLLLWNKGLDGSSGGDASTLISSMAIELLANNSYVNTYNGKAKIGCDSGRNTGTTIERDGQLWFGLRRTDNSGFDRILKIRSISTTGKGSIESIGSTLSILPDRDYGTASTLQLSDSYQNAIGLIRASASTRTAQLDVYGNAATYIRSRSDLGQAAAYIQSEASNANSYLALRANWTTTGTGSSIIDMLTNSNDTGFRIQSNGSTGRFNIRYRTAATQYENIDIDPSNNGRVSIYANTNNKQANLRLGNGSGTNAGGVISYDDDTGILSVSGTNTTLSIPKLRISTGASNGYILTSDASGNASWAASSSAIMATVQKTSLSDVSTSLTTLSVVDIVSNFTQIGSRQMVQTAGWIEFVDGVGNLSSFTIDFNLNSWFSPQSFALHTSKGIVSGNYSGIIRDVSYTITTNSNQMRITCTNASGSSYSGGRISFNILSINAL